MATIDVNAIGEGLSQLVDEAASGAEVIFSRDGRPVARLTPLEPPVKRKRVLGLLAGKISVPDDFDAPLPDDILDLFEGR